MRGPLEVLMHDLAEIGGLPAGAVQLVGETTLAHLKTRPDYAVTVSKALVGFIKVKAPGKGADPRRFADPHDKDQWSKLKSLPNLIYTDGNAFSLWRDGEIVGQVIHLAGDVATSGAKLEAPPTLLPLISDFLGWTPIPPSTARKLAEVSARLCRFLRDEVVEQMELGIRASPISRRTGASCSSRKRRMRSSPTAMRKLSPSGFLSPARKTSSSRTASTMRPASCARRTP